MPLTIIHRWKCDVCGDETDADPSPPRLVALIATQHQRDGYQRSNLHCDTRLIMNGWKWVGDKLVCPKHEVEITDSPKRETVEEEFTNEDVEELVAAFLRDNPTHNSPTLGHAFKDLPTVSGWYFYLEDDIWEWVRVFRRPGRAAQMKIGGAWQIAEHGQWIGPFPQVLMEETNG